MKTIDIGKGYTIDQWQISNLIADLEKVKKEHGDLLVYYESGAMTHTYLWVEDYTWDGGEKILDIG